MSEKLRVAPLTRELSLSDFRMERAENGPTKLRFSASSEYPVERFFGREILVHNAKAIRMERVKKGAVPLLFNHDMNDVIGMVDGMSIDGDRLMCDAHLFSTPRAREVEQMLEGGLRNVSIRYRIHKVEEGKDGDERVTDWEPLEQSIVTIPADPTVGLGRAGDDSQAFEATRIGLPRDNGGSAATTTERGMEMTDETKTPEKGRDVAAAENSAERGVDKPKFELQPEKETRVEVRDNSQGREQGRDAPVEFERRRRQGIDKLCQINKIDEKIRDYWVGAGLSLEEVADDLLRIIEERGNTNPQPVSKIGLSNKEAQGFSMLRAIEAAVNKDWKMAPFELECSRAIASKLNKSPDPFKFYVPFEVMSRGSEGRRDLDVASTGANLVGTDNQSFIEMLRNRSVAFNMGVRRLSGLVGNVTVPRQDGAATAYWLSSETTQITESTQSFGQVSLSPKTVGAYTEISRQLLLQSSPDAEGIVNSDLAIVCALAVDLAVLNGSGASGQPTGIIGTSGVGTVPSSDLAFADILEFQTDVAAANVMPTAGGYVTTPTVASLLMQRVKYTSTASPLWEGNIWNGNMVGFRAMSSNQMPAGNMLFGDWSEAVVGEWGVLEVETNPYANFQAGIIGVRAMYSVDVAVRRAAAFSHSSSIT